MAPLRVLVHFFDEWTDFRVQEFNALLEMLGVEEAGRHELMSLSADAAFAVTTLPSAEVARQLCERVVLVRAVYELWAHADTLPELVAEMRRLPVPSLPSLTAHDKSWCIDVHAYCRSVSHADKESCRQQFKFLGFAGPVVLEGADASLALLLDFSAAATPSSSSAAASSSSSSTSSSSLSPSAPTHASVPCFFGRLLARGGLRQELKKYDLKRRLYLGPTSLDHELAFVMANLAGAERGCMALDPFCGTASLLVALTHFGARCTGMDIDVRVLRGAMYAGGSRHAESTDPHAAPASFVPGVVSPPLAPAPSAAPTASASSVKRGIFETFAQYSLSPPELVRMDLHLLERHTHLASALGLFDVIVTDPPYGIRAGGRKSGKAQGCGYTIAAEARGDHIPSTQNYPVEEVMLDLLHCAALLLRRGGSLCYLLPTSYDFLPSDLPTHPCLDLTRLCHQGLSTRHGRHCVVMRKMRDHDAAAQAAFAQYRASILAGTDTAGFGKLLGKLEVALASGGYDNEAVVKSASKAALRRKESARARRAEPWAGREGGEESGGERAAAAAAAAAPVAAV